MAVPFSNDDNDEGQNILLLIDQLVVNVHLLVQRHRQLAELNRQCAARDRVRRVAPVTPQHMCPSPVISNEIPAQQLQPTQATQPEAVPIQPTNITAKVPQQPNIWQQTGIELRHIADSRSPQTADNKGTSVKPATDHAPTTSLLKTGLKWTATAIISVIRFLLGKR